MWKGKLESIHIAPEAKAPMQSVAEVMVTPGVGPEGDRYAMRQGTFFKPEPDREITLIEAEAAEAFTREYSVPFSPGEARRNLVTRGVPLNHLVQKEFHVGDVKLKGIRLCEPCSHLEAVTGRPVIKGLMHRGGLRAQILTQGVIRVGDPVRE
jgi:MOSC domain-containing protein YiiM